MANVKCVLPHKDVHIKTFIAGFSDKPVLEICNGERRDGTFCQSLQFTSRKDALILANAILEAAEFLPEDS